MPNSQCDDDIPPDSQKEADLFQDTPLCYLGYASQIGEAFRYFLRPKLLGLAYVVAFSYVTGATASKAKQEYEGQVECKDMQKVALVGADTFLWHTFASIVIPGLILRRMTTFVFDRLCRWPCFIRRVAVVGVGVMTIPFIVRPVDDLVDNVLDETLRKITPTPPDDD